jgi:predicted permease
MKGILIIAPLIGVVVLGMILRAIGFLKESDRDGLTKLLDWVALPALLFSTAYVAGGKIAGHGNLFLTPHVAMVAISAITFAIAVPFTHRGEKSRQAVSVMASIRSNYVYLGIPACMLALGEAGVEAASIFLAIILPGHNVISILLGEIIYSGRVSASALGAVVVKVLKNPMVVSCLAGLASAQLKIPVPETLMITLKLVSDMATGVALIAIGMSLEFKGLAAAFRHAWHDALIRLALYPGMIWILFQIWPVPELFMRAAVIVSAMPTAVNTFIVAKGMKLDHQYACEIIAVSTILAPVTIPIWIAVLGIK